MENKENRGLIDKKASKDQWAGLVSVSFLSVQFWSSHSILSLSYSWTLRVLGAHLESVAYLDAWGKKVKKEKESTRGNWDQQLQWVFLVGTELHVCFPH